mmetsp:Transcript_22694/g.37339  ORF Transcript_22694/g.37339 Transcript_22694/m.37339 type:complete len:411 (-) Transcript_22694:3483-4715(-)
MGVDVHVLDQLVIDLAHFDAAAPHVLVLHPLKGIGDLHHIGGGARFVDRFGQHLNHIGDARLTDIAIRVFGLERLIIGRSCVADGWVDLSFGDQSQGPFTCFAKGRCDAVCGRIIGKDRTVIAVFQHRFAQAQHVRAPIACDDGIRTGGHDLAAIGREILDLADGVQLIPDNLDIGALFPNETHGRRGHGLAEGIVLADDIYLFDGLILRNHIRQRVHLDVGIGVKAEVPEVALVIGQGRIHGGVIQKQHPVIRVAAIVLLDRLGQRIGHTGGVALGDIADALIDGDLQLDQGFLGADLVVEGDDLEHVTVQHAALFVHQLFGGEFILVQAVHARARKGAAERIDEGNFNGIGGDGKGADRQGQCRGQAKHNGFAHVFLPRTCARQSAVGRASVSSGCRQRYTPPRYVKR